jgi:hypothetical protein
LLLVKGLHKNSGLLVTRALHKSSDLLLVKGLHKNSGLLVTRALHKSSDLLVVVKALY